MKDVPAHIAYRRQSRRVMVAVAMIVALITVFGWLALSRLQDAEASWEGYTQRSTNIRQAMADLQRNIGYGGFIYNFKNLVLKRDFPRYQAVIDRDITHLNTDLDQLGNLLRTPADQADLARLRATFAEYARKYDAIPQLIRDGKSSAEIDAAVKVSDATAIAAMERIITRNIEQAHSAKQRAQALQASALLFLRLGGLLVLAAIVAGTATMLLFQKHVVAANEAKRNFLASMSHEIRTPMNAILGLSYLLENAELPADASSLARKIGAAGRSLLSIIDDILDFSKIEAGRLEIEHEPFYLGEVLDNLGTIMSAYAIGKSIELVITPPPTGDYYLRGDAQRLNQVLINLVGNAIKFTDSGDVETAVRVVEETEQLITFRFAVRDTGIGISPEKQQHIFAPFSQADTTITRRFGGTGLGLTICRRLVSLMGGELGVVSEPGRGSEFWFTLSFDRLPGVRLSSLEMAHLDVLIADDNPTALAALCNAAVGLGWKATAVGSGEDAIKYMLSTPAAIALETVLIFDWQMPGMDGFAAARAIKAALKDGRNPIVIMVTAYSRDELLSHPDSAVADAVLTKPVTPSSLYAAVAKAQQKRGGGLVPATKRQRLQRLNGVRILVVDDSDINREVAQRILAAEGAHIVLANDGQQAVDWLNAHAGEIDMVLMDLQMPVMDGYEASRLIRRTPELADLPVIALTAGAFKEQQDAAKSAGMSDYISKPFDVEAAIALILGYTSRLAPSASAGVTMPDPVAHHHPEDLPGLAVGRGLMIWQDASVYRQYLRKFVRDYGDSVREMADAERTVAATLAHKLTGAAGSLALAEIAALAAEVDHVLRAGDDPATALAKLALVMTTSLESIARYAPLDPSADIRPVGGNENTTRLAPLMVRLLRAFNADSPDAVRPVLAELDKLLPPAHLVELGNALESFDFRGGEVATKALAAQLRISLEV